MRYAWYLLILLFPLYLMGQTLAGEWTFDNPANLLGASVGNDLTLVGSHTLVQGPSAGNSAIRIGTDSHYQCNHGIPANGGGNMVNEFTLVFDFKLNDIGPWRCFFQTYYPNSWYNDGDCFINNAGQIGLSDTGYTPHPVFADEWYRLIVAVDLGSSYKYYLDGCLALDGGSQARDGRFSLYPSDPSEPLLLFADNDGEDGSIDIAYSAIYYSCLNDSQASALGGYGHTITPASEAMLPYLQTPKPNSMYICWHESSSSESRVEYGTTPTLGSSQTGTVYEFDSNTVWHKVKLQNLLPDTEYFYQCYSGIKSSELKAFRTPPALGTRTGHFRFVIAGDSQTHYEVSAGIVNRIDQKLTELYGDDWHNDVQLFCHAGDTVYLGPYLPSYITQHFIPFGSISGRIPIMVATGNHEFESDYHYQYRTYEELGGPEGEKYYNFDIGPMRFLFLNPNISTGTQSVWLADRIAEANSNPDLDWIFTMSHMPAYAELWIAGNDSWAQNTVIPILETSAKAAMFISGHSHNYERGVAPTAELTTIISGGCGGEINRWEEYANANYPNTLIAMDHYNWLLVDIDLQDRSYHATMYSMGHSDLPRVNEILDEWEYEQIPEVLADPVAVSEFATPAIPLTLIAGQDACWPEPIGTRFQISPSASFSTDLTDRTRYYTDIYGDTGSPLWMPTDLNEGIDLWRLHILSATLTEGNTYYWRVKARDPNLAWSDWSAPRQFVYEIRGPEANFIVLGDTLQPFIEVQFIDTSIGSPVSYNWDLNGDGVTDSAEPNPVWVYTDFGVYNVTLAVMIEGQQYSVTHQVALSQPEPPADLTITVSGEDVVLAWDGDPTAQTWSVWASDDPYAGFEFVGSCDTNSFTLTGETQLYPQRFYYVLAHQ